MESKKDQFGIRRATQSGEMNVTIIALLAKGKEVTGESLRKAMGEKYSRKRVDSHVAWMKVHGLI